MCIWPEMPSTHLDNGASMGVTLEEVIYSTRIETFGRTQKTDKTRRRIQTFHRLQHWTDMISDSSSAVSSIVLSENTPYLSKSTLSILQSPRHALGSSLSDSLGFNMMMAMPIVILHIWGQTMSEALVHELSLQWVLAWAWATLLGVDHLPSRGWASNDYYGTPCPQLRISVDSKVV